MLPFFFSETPHPAIGPSLNFFTFGEANAFLSLYTDRKSFVCNEETGGKGCCLRNRMVVGCRH